MPASPSSLACFGTSSTSDELALTFSQIAPSTLGFGLVLRREAITASLSPFLPLASQSRTPDFGPATQTVTHSLYSLSMEMATRHLARLLAWSISTSAPRRPTNPPPLIPNIDVSYLSSGF